MKDLVLVFQVINSLVPDTSRLNFVCAFNRRPALVNIVCAFESSSWFTCLRDGLFLVSAYIDDDLFRNEDTLPGSLIDAVCGQMVRELEYVLPFLSGPN